MRLRYVCGFCNAFSIHSLPGPSKVMNFLYYLHFDLVLYISGMFCLKKCKWYKKFNSLFL